MATYQSQVPDAQSIAPEATPGRAAAVLDAPASKQQDVSKLAAGAGVALGGRIFGRGLLLMVDVALARLLGPVQYGLYVIGWTITRLATLLAPLGLNSGVIRFGARFWRRDDARFKGVLWQSIFSSAISALVIAIPFFLAAPWLATSVFAKPELAPTFRWFAWAFPMASVLTVAAAATRISQRMKYGVLAEDLSQPTFALILLFVLVGLLKQQLTGALIACVASYGLSMLIGLYFVKRLFPVVLSPKLHAVFPGKELIAFSLPASVTGVLGVMIIWVNRLFVGYYRSAGEVGIYQVASQVPVTVGLVVGAVAAIFAPMTADFAHRGQLAQVHEIYKIGTKWTLYASMPALLLMWMAPREIISVLFGASYAGGTYALMTLAFGQLMNAASGCVGTLLVMTGHQKITSALYMMIFALNIILSVLFIPRWGVSGAAWATTCTAVCLFLPAMVIAWYRLRMVPYDRRYWKLLVATALTAGAMLIPVPSLSSVMRLVLECTLATGVFWTTLFCMGLDAEDRHFLTLLRTRLKFLGS
jgi:O-antigen/teichoic acid export membrane protein